MPAESSLFASPEPRPGPDHRWRIQQQQGKEHKKRILTLERTTSGTRGWRVAGSSAAIVAPRYDAAMTDRRLRRSSQRLVRSRLGWRPRNRLSSTGLLRGGFLGPDRADVRQSLGALVLSAVASIVAGLILASRRSQFDAFPGLLLFIPSAIALRGNVFGPMGSRLSTAIQTGTFGWSFRPDSVLGENLIAVLINTLAAGLGLAGFAELFARTLSDTGVAAIGFSDFIVVSVVGGLLASVVVLGVALGLTVASARFGWDLDNVTAPMVTAASDVITLPALMMTTVLLGRGWLTFAIAAVAVGLVVLGLVLLVRSSLDRAKRIVLESIPVLIAAGILSLVAGTAIEAAGGRLSWVFLVLLPGYLGSAGALGGILANRLSTKVHLGLVEASLIPRGTARSDMGFTLALAAPIFVFLVLLAEGTALVFGGDSPGFAMLLAVVLSAGAVATIFVLGVAYYGTLAVVRFGLDPDNMGIPMVTAALDVVGALTLISAVSVWGVT